MIRDMIRTVRRGIPTTAPHTSSGRRTTAIQADHHEMSTSATTCDTSAGTTMMMMTVTAPTHPTMTPTTRTTMTATTAIATPTTMMIATQTATTTDTPQILIGPGTAHHTRRPDQRTPTPHSRGTAGTPTAVVHPRRTGSLHPADQTSRLWWITATVRP